MSTLTTLTVAETKLFLRDPMSSIFGLLFPTLLLLGLGAIPVLREPAEEFGGTSFVVAWAPAALVLGLGIIGLQQIPVVIATYRERGILRRMSTTPVHPAKVLAAQLIVALGGAILSALLLIFSSWLLLGVPLPQNPVWFALAFVTGFAALLAIGVLIAAVAPTVRFATGLATVAYIAAMIAGGVYLPRFLLPDFLVQVGAYVPPGVQALLDTWAGSQAAAADAVATPPLILQVGILATIAVVVGGAAAKMFRWE